MVSTIPFTYLIGWSKQNIWYYGVRYKDGANPLHLWTKYFTSSKLVKNYRVIFGEPDVIQIRKTFSSKSDARLWESKVNRRLTVKSEKFLNQFDGTEKFGTLGMVPAIDVRTGQSILVSQTEYVENKGTKYKHHTTGRVNSDKIKADISKRNTGKVPVIDIETGDAKVITTEEFYKLRDIKYKALSEGRTLNIDPKLKDLRSKAASKANEGFVPCFDTQTLQRTRVTKEEFGALKNIRYLRFNSKEYIENFKNQ